MFPIVVKLLEYIYICIYIYTHAHKGRDSSVGIATRYELNGPGIESRWGRDIPHPSRPALGLPSLLYSGYRVSFPRVKRTGRGVGHTSTSSAEVKERIQL